MVPEETAARTIWFLLICRFDSATTGSDKVQVAIVSVHLSDLRGEHLRSFSPVGGNERRENSEKLWREEHPGGFFLSRTHTRVGVQMLSMVPGSKHPRHVLRGRRQPKAAGKPCLLRSEYDCRNTALRRRLMTDNISRGANASLLLDIEQLPLLDKLQLGHLRHIDNLSRQPPNDWSFMSGRAANQEDFGGYRFQLAYMAYALGLTYFHRLPAAPGVFRPIFRRLIEKMLHPAVWMYWRNVSRGGAIFNAHLADQLSEQWNPVERDNIMYSAYVQSMALMYDVLFNDPRYSEPGALTFRHWSFF